MSENASAVLRGLFEGSRERFAQARRVLSFEEFAELFATNAPRYGRDSARYLRDMFEFYGVEELARPYGSIRRFKLFDLPWEDASGRNDALVGNESVQADVFRAVQNFARQGKVDRMVLLHGPNGSSKSTFVACLMRAMEDYSRRDEGALYRFHWVFPRGRGSESKIGFGQWGEEAPRPGESYAHLDEALIDAKLPCELRDHPLLLLPVELRRELLAGLGKDITQELPRHLQRGSLCPKCRLVFDALFSAYRGDLGRVLAHVQIERWEFSRKYREGVGTIGPQMAVDAHERQVTASRSLAALPPSLQNVALFEYFGEIVDAAAGLIEFSDLLKRPLEAWKYLLTMIETGEVAMTTATLSPDLVFIGSSNEGHVDAFRDHPEFASFRGRFEFVRAPYLIDWTLEKRIYEQQVVPGVRRHVAPHATELASLFAVLTRLRKPTRDHVGRSVGQIVVELSPLEKAELYARAKLPARLTGDQAKELRSGIESLYRQGAQGESYEGRLGASPRELRTLLLDAAQHPEYQCLSPFATLEQIAVLCARKSEFEWLRVEPVPGGYHDPVYFQKVLRDRLLDHLEDELRGASGLVDEARYLESFERYLANVNSWVKGEKIRNKLTGKDADPDETMMRDTEKLFGAPGSPAEFRRNLISTVAAWAIDHPGQRVDPIGLFPHYLQKLKDAFFVDRRRQVVLLTRDLVVLTSEDGAGLDAEQRAAAEKCLDALVTTHGYCRDCARDAAAALLKERFVDVKL